MSQQTLTGTPVTDNRRPYCPVDFPASRLVMPGSEKARKMTVSSGRKCYEWCRNSGPLGLLERMLLESSAWNSTIVLLAWRVSVTPAGRSLFQLAASVPGTDGNGCSSLLPTPDTCPEAPNANCNRIYPKNLLQAAQDGYSPVMFPTPTAPGGHQVGRIEEWGGSGNPIRDGMNETPGFLNPLWVELLMGFPCGYTDIAEGG